MTAIRAVQRPSTSRPGPAVTVEFGAYTRVGNVVVALLSGWDGLPVPGADFDSIEPGSWERPQPGVWYHFVRRRADKARSFTVRMRPGMRVTITEFSGVAEVVPNAGTTATG